jgi:peroxiredoxin Q/BCP
MLKAGDAAPAFEGQSSTGGTVSSEILRGNWLVLYFYPKAFTPLCTQETRRFRDNYDDLRSLGAEVVGISVDDLDTQCRFAQSNEVRFPLVTDRGKKISKSFGVLWPLIGIDRRVTFIIDPDGIIRAVFHHELQVSKHLDDVFNFLRRQVLPAAG